MTAQKLDFLLAISPERYPQGDPVKVRIFVNEYGEKVARFENNALFPDCVAIEYLPEVICVMQQVLNAAADTPEVKPYVSQLRQEVRAAHFARMALLAHGRDDAQSTT